MIFKIEVGDLFELKDTHLLVHCISRDCALGAGIASTFKKYYPDLASDLSIYIKQTNTDRRCLIFKGKVANLITKERYFNKPTYDDIQLALDELKQIIINKGYTKIAMPKIGCGLDNLSWVKVKKMIIQTFNELNIEIIVRVYC